MTYRELCSILRNPTIESLEKFGEFVEKEPPTSWLKKQVSYSAQGIENGSMVILRRHGFPIWVCLFDIFVDVRWIHEDKNFNRVLDDLYRVALPEWTTPSSNYACSLHQVFYSKRKTRHLKGKTRHNPFLYDLIDGLSQPKPISHSFDVMRIYGESRCAFLFDKRSYDVAFFLFFISYMEGNNKLLSNKDLSEILKLADVGFSNRKLGSWTSSSVMECPLIIDLILKNLDMRSNTTDLLGNSLGLTYDMKWIISQRCLKKWPKISEKTTSMFFSHLDLIIPSHYHQRARVCIDNLIEAGVMDQFLRTRFGEYYSRKLVESVHNE